MLTTGQETTNEEVIINRQIEKRKLQIGTTLFVNPPNNKMPKKHAGNENGMGNRVIPSFDCIRV